MRRLREIIYINGNIDEKTFVFYGIEFRDFINYLPNPIDHILLLKHEYLGDFHYPTGFQYVKDEEVLELAKEEVYNYGDFCWVDFEDEKNLDELSKQDIAEVLYLAHMYKPLKTPFFEKLNNRFAYCAHDDGWYGKIYCKDIEEFGHVLEKVIKNSILKLRKRKLVDMESNLKEKLLKLSEDGLLIEVYKTYKDQRSIWIPIHTIGKFTDMDLMYNDLKIHKAKAKFQGYLVHQSKRWVLK
ncbi:peptide ABC transporter permease [Anaerophilus nitritogenes]|uniref:peptide ABC transporter permease n=1 Tax=Anaerophilus nitritogenes TaxID=2498136 RepID=UPI00101D8ECF|nr:peptide ABC transporter permease [Anaerophilus nitritogenes]